MIVIGKRQSVKIGKYEVKKNYSIFFIFFIISNSYSIEADVFVQSLNRASKILSENLSKEEKN